MSARKFSHRTIFLIVSNGSPLALIASSLRSTSKKPVCPMTRSLDPPMAHCGQRVRFVATWREEFFEVSSGFVSVTLSMSARKSSHRTIFLIVSNGSPLALIASSLRSTSKKPVCPMTRSPDPPMAHCGQRVRFVATWREEFFEVPFIWRPEFVAVKIEEIKSIRLERSVIIDRGVDLEQPLVELELAEVSRRVAEALQDGAHIRSVSAQARNIAGFHLIEDAVDLRRRAADKRGARGRAHRRGRVVIAKVEPPPSQLGTGRQLEIAGRQQMICLLVGNDENDVVRRLGGAAGCGGLRPGVWRSIRENQGSQRHSANSKIRPYRSQSHVRYSNWR